MKKPTKIIIGKIDFSNRKETREMIKNHPLVSNWWEYIKRTGKTRKEPNNQMKTGYMGVLRQFLYFLSCGPEENQELTLESLIHLGKIEEVQNGEVIKETKLEGIIQNFFNWLIGTTPKDYKPKERAIGWNSAIQASHSRVRSFFSSQNVGWTKWFRTPIKEDSAVLDKDEEGKNQLMEGKGLDHDKLGEFLDKLNNLRDQVILGCMLTSGIDIGDLLAMKISDLKETQEHCYYKGKREKTRIQFTALFTKNVSEKLKFYIANFRKEAKPEDLVFVSNKYTEAIEYERKKRFGIDVKEGEKETVKVSQKIKANTITTKFRLVALDLGYVKPNHEGKREQHCFRPKRFRHLFIGICRANGVREEYISYMLGHKTSQTGQYGRVPIINLIDERKNADEYLEPFKKPGMKEHEESLKKLVSENEKIKAEVFDLREKNLDLDVRFEGVKKEFQDLDRETRESRVEITELRQMINEMQPKIDYVDDLTMNSDKYKEALVKYEVRLEEKMVKFEEEMAKNPDLEEARKKRLKNRKRTL